MQVEGKTVLVVGTGKSGIAATELLVSKGIDTILFDGNKDLNVDKLYADNPKLKDIPLVLGELEKETLDKVSICVLSPGVPTDIPMVNEMRDQGIAIWGEIELAYYFGKGRIIAITGTNGKTTTTALTGFLHGYFILE